MKKIGMILVVLVVLAGVGCSSNKSTITKVDDKLSYYSEQVSTYSILLEEKDSEKATELLNKAKDILDSIHNAGAIGDSISRKEHINALVEVLVLLEKYKESK